MSTGNSDSGNTVPVSSQPVQQKNSGTNAANGPENKAFSLSTGMKVPSDEKSHDSDGQPEWVNWSIAGLIVLIVVVLVAWIVLKFRKHKATKPKKRAIETNQSEVRHSKSIVVSSVPEEKRDRDSEDLKREKELNATKVELQKKNEEIRRLQSELRRERDEYSATLDRKEREVESRVNAKLQDINGKCQKLQIALDGKERECSARLVDTEKRSRAEIENLARVHAEKIHTLNTQIDAERSAHKNEIAAKEEECASRLSEANARHEFELADVQARSRAEIENLERKHAEEIRVLNTQIDTERSAHKNEIAAKEKECVERLSDARAKHESAIEEKNREIAGIRARSREEIARLEKACAGLLSRFFPDISGGNEELAEYSRKWVSEMRDAEDIPDSVMGMLSQLFCWETAVRKGKLTAQYDSLAEFSRNFFEWCKAQGMSAEDSRALAARFADAFNASVLTSPLIPEDKRVCVFVPEIGVAYDAKRMVPSSSAGSKVGTTVQIETWGIITAGKKPEMKKRANVVLK